jgi:hypothetical protein
MTSGRRGGHPQEAVVTPIGQCLRRGFVKMPRFFYARRRAAGPTSVLKQLRMTPACANWLVARQRRCTIERGDNPVRLSQPVS